jgi:hypothetical protein
MDAKPILPMDVTVWPMSESDLTAVLMFWRGMPGVGLNESDTPACLRADLKVLQRHTTNSPEA